MQQLLLLHGAVGSEKQLVPISCLLEDRYEVHTLNFEGHGGRPGGDVFSFDRFAANILEYLEKNEIKKCFLFGYSMGGYAALRFALLHPEKVAGIVTLATKFNWSPEIAAKETAMLNPAVIEEKVPKFAAALNTLHAPLDWKVVMKKTADLLITLGDGKGLSVEDLAAVTAPVLLCLGSEDTMVSREETEAAASALQNAETEIIEGGQHMLERTDPALIAASIRNFVARN